MDEEQNSFEYIPRNTCKECGAPIGNLNRQRCARHSAERAAEQARQRAKARYQRLKAEELQRRLAMTEPTNIDRAGWAETALKAFEKVTGSDAKEEGVRDLLADMMHYCDVNDIDFANELRVATDNYDEEITEEQDAKEEGNDF
jgi:hypothetical protein